MLTVNLLYNLNALLVKAINKFKEFMKFSLKEDSTALTVSGINEEINLLEK